VIDGTQLANRAVLPAETRVLMVRQLGAALAEAWRRQHARHNELQQLEANPPRTSAVEEGAAAGASTTAAKETAA